MSCFWRMDVTFKFEWVLRLPKAALQMATNDVQGHSSTSKRQENMDKEAKVKVICLGDSAVGKSK